METMNTSHIGINSAARRVLRKTTRLTTVALPDICWMDVGTRHNTAQHVYLCGVAEEPKSLRQKFRDAKRQSRKLDHQPKPVGQVLEQSLAALAATPATRRDF